MNRYTIVLKPLALGLLFSLVLPGCDSSTSSSKSSSAGAITSLCNRVAQCMDTPATAAFMQQCQLATGSLSSVLVDPESFSSCIEDLACSAISDEPKIQACLDLDPTTIRCGEEGLLACTNAGQCREIDCHEACATVGATYFDCGPNAQYGYDTCLCQ